MNKATIVTLTTIVISLLVANVGYSQLADSPWPMFRHDAKHTGRCEYSGPNFPELLWTIPDQGYGTSSPAIGDCGIIYYASSMDSGDNYLRCIGADGTVHWSYPTGMAWYTSPAIDINGIIYIGSYDNNLYAVNSGTASLNWSFYTGGYIYSSPVIGSEGNINFGSLDHFIYSIKPNGFNRWKYSASGSVTSAPAMDEGRTVFVTSNDGNLYALNPNGSLGWSYEAGNNIGSSPAIGEDGTIYFGCNDDNFYAVNPDGSLQWTYFASGVVFSSPGIGEDGTIYFGSGDHNLYALNPDGTLKWTFKAESNINSSPSIDGNGVIYFGSFDQYLYAVFPDGTEKWRFKTKGSVDSSPAICDGTVYFGSWDGNLYALGDANRAPYVRISSNQEVYRMGDTIEVNVNVSNPTDMEYLDMYAAIFLSGNLFWYPNWGVTPEPKVINDSKDSTLIARIEYNSFIPPGNYSFYAAITHHGSVSVIDIASVTFGIE